MTLSDKQWGLLFTLVGPGGAGKNTLMGRVLGRIDRLSKLATATTRERRDHEKPGYDHLFLTLEQFRQMRDNNELLEHQEVTPDKFYGIPRASVETKIFVGDHLIADIEVNGAKILRATYPEQVILIFVTVPGATLEDKLEILGERMRKRGDKEDVVQKRLQRAVELEFPFEPECDYVIVNDDEEAAGERLYEIIITETLKVIPQDA